VKRKTFKVNQLIRQTTAGLDADESPCGVNLMQDSAPRIQQSTGLVNDIVQNFFQRAVRIEHGDNFTQSFSHLAPLLDLVRPFLHLAFQLPAARLDAPDPQPITAGQPRRQRQQDHPPEPPRLPDRRSDGDADRHPVLIPYPVVVRTPDPQDVLTGF
jgi:hypothetical protein